MSEHDSLASDWHEALERLDAPDAVQVRGPSTTRQRRARRRFRPLTVVAIAVAASLMSVTAAWAFIPPFTDVEASNPFLQEIRWLKDTGITEGYADGTFRPTQNITRQSLAAWMQRLFDLRDTRAMAYSNTSFSTTSTTFVPLVPNASVTLVVPPGTYASVAASFTAETSCAGSTGGYCKAKMVIDDVGDANPAWAMDPDDAQFALDSDDENTESSSSYEGHGFQRTEGWLDAGTYTVTVQVASSNATTSFYLDDWSLVVETSLLPSDSV